MLIAVEVAGFTMAQADVLRKAMGKKKPEVMEEQKELFLDGAEGRGVDRKKAAALWDYIEPFAGYGFNKSHCVAYAMLAYKTAYLKEHYPVAFMAAMLNSELGNSDAVAKYIRRVPGDGNRRAAAGPQPEQLVLHRRRRSHPLRPRGGQGDRRERGGGDAGGPPDASSASTAWPTSPPRSTSSSSTTRCSRA